MIAAYLPCSRSRDAPANDGDPIASYALRYCAGADCLLAPEMWFGSHDSGSSETTRVLTGLTNGVTYRFQVVPFNHTESEHSDPTTSTPTA